MTFTIFFQDCYHLKDWIKNDCGLNREIRGQVEDFITKSKYIKIVADIANATKHLKLTKTYRIDEEIDIEIIDVYSGDKKQEMIAVKIKNQIEKKEYFGSFSLPLEALKEWSKFLHRFKLGTIKIVSQ